MRQTVLALTALATLTSAAGSACAMNADPVAHAECVVINGAKLPPEIGGEHVVCAAIKDALNARGIRGPVQVAVEVKSGSWLVARVVRDGVSLPDQNLAVADGKLQKGSVERFARAIAEAASTAG